MIRIVGAVTAAALLSCSTPSSAGADTFLRMVSGPAGGNWYPLGAKLMEIVNRSLEGVVTSNAPGGGGSNAQDVNRGDAEVGLSYAHTVLQAWNGTGPTGKKHPNLRFIATLYPAAIQTAVRADSDIHSYTDLHDRNISPGKAKWSGYEAAKIIFAQHGFGVGDVRASGGTVHHVSYSDSVALMRDGHIDAFTALTSVPQASFIDLEFSIGIRFLPVEDAVRAKILTTHPGYIETIIPKEAYESLDEDIPTIGAATVFVANKDVSDDVIYGLTRLLWEHHSDLVKVSLVWSGAKFENALSSAKIPLHPGAQRYYEEMGILR